MGEKQHLLRRPLCPRSAGNELSQTQARDVRPHQVHHVPLLGREVGREEESEGQGNQGHESRPKDHAEIAKGRDQEEGHDDAKEEEGHDDAEEEEGGDAQEHAQEEDVNEEVLMVELEKGFGALWVARNEGLVLDLWPLPGTPKARRRTRLL